MDKPYKEPDRIRQYMASLEANLAKATGKTLDQWVKIAKTCPHSRVRDRLNWFRTEHALGQSRASLVLWKAFGTGLLDSDNPGQLVDNLFAKAPEGQREIYEKIVRAAAKFGNGTITPRKSYVALYRLKQYAAIKPSRKGLLVGIALVKYPRDERLVEVKNLGGGDRNRKALLLTAAKDFDATARAILQSAFDQA